MVMLRCTVHVLTAGRSLRSADQVISDVSRFRLKGKEKKKKQTNCGTVYDFIPGPDFH